MRGNGKKNLLYALDSLGQLHEGGAARQERDTVRAIKAAVSLLGGRGGRVLLMTASNSLEKVSRSERGGFLFLFLSLGKGSSARSSSEECAGNRRGACAVRS